MMLWSQAEAEKVMAADFKPSHQPGDPLCLICLVRPLCMDLWNLLRSGGPKWYQITDIQLYCAQRQTGSAKDAVPKVLQAITSTVSHKVLDMVSLAEQCRGYSCCWKHSRNQKITAGLTFMVKTLLTGMKQNDKVLSSHGKCLLDVRCDLCTQDAISKIKCSFTWTCQSSTWVVSTKGISLGFQSLPWSPLHA